MREDYYSLYYQMERKHWWFKVRNKIIFDLAGSLAGGRKLKILNVGAATGYTTELLAEYGEVTTVEYDKPCYEYIKTFLKGEIVNASVTDLPFADNSFDMVCAFDVIEHVKEDQLAVSELGRVCNKNGTIFITVPAHNFLWSEHDVINHHIKRYKSQEVLKLFSNYTIIYSTYFNFFLFPPVALFRVLKTLIFGLPNVERATSDFKSHRPTFTSRILGAVFLSENWFIKRRLSFPTGVSFLLVAGK
jgi:2-polyprenyl-3-methyl-5-hydroxy-6-metoxy-1,4-benzoquinol methylase